MELSLVDGALGVDHAGCACQVMVSEGVASLIATTEPSIITAPLNTLNTSREGFTTPTFENPVGAS